MNETSLSGRIVDPSQGLDGPGTIRVRDGRIVSCEPGTPVSVDHGSLVIAPGLLDMRVFVGEPGSEHRETIRSAGEAAVAGGVTTFVTMPDTSPPVDDVALVEFMSRTGRTDSPAKVRPAAALTRGLRGTAMAELYLLSEAGAVALTDGAREVADPALMRRLLAYTSDFDALVMQTNRNAALEGRGVMNEGRMSARLGLPGIPREAETVSLERDLRLLRATGCRYHAATVTTADSVDLIRRAKAEGLNVTASTPVTHATLNENDVDGYRTFLRLSPPLREEDDRLAVVEGLADGTIDAIVSGHDPQDVDTKRLPFAEAADGAIGLETLLAATLRLYHADALTLSQVIDRLSCAPARILRLEGGSLAPGMPADFVVFDPDEPWQVLEADIRSRSKNTPYENARFSGRVRRTYVDGDCVFDREEAEQ